MMWSFYIFTMCLVALAVGVMLRKYAAPKVTPVVLLITCAAWMTSLSVVALVPVDVMTTLDHDQPPALSTLWSISYWSTQVLTWAVIPILQGYAISGAFTILGRLHSALRRLWLFYLIIGVLSVVGVLAALAAGRLRLATLPKLIVTLSNTYGLIVIIALLGYGLVEIPRIFWRRSFPEKRLKWHYHRVGRAADKLTDASAELERSLGIVLATSQQVSRADLYLRQYANRLVQYANEYSPVGLSEVGRSASDIEGLQEGDLDYADSVEGLASLRGRLKAAIANFTGCRGEYVAFVKKAIELEAVCKSRQHGVYKPTPRGSSGRADVAAWFYKCQLRPWVQRAAALGSLAVSATIVWSEATIATGTHPDLSPFSLAIHGGQALSQLGAQLVVAAPLVYMCGCAYFSLFKLGNFGFYHVVPGSTWSYSLLLNGSLLARFAAPLCFNFLHVIRMNEYLAQGERMVFVQKMGSMNDVPVLGHDFNTWFPLLLAAYVAALALNWWERCASKLFIARRFRFDTERCDDEHTSSGMRLVKLEEDGQGQGFPVGEGIGLFGMSSTPRAGASAGGKQRGTVEMHSPAGQAPGKAAGAGSAPRGAWPGGLAGSGSGSLNTRLLGSGDSSSSGAGGEPAPAAQSRLGAWSKSSSAAPPPPPRYGAWSKPGEEDVDGLFAGIEGRRSRAAEEPAEQAAGGRQAGEGPSLLKTFGWRRGT